MYDDNPEEGVEIDLRWKLDSLYYKDSSGTYPLGELEGAHTLTVLADLDSDTVEVKVDGVTVGSALSLSQPVNPDTVRFLVSDLNEQMFAGRCFDNVSLKEVQSQGSNGIIDRALAGLRSALTTAWQWLGEQLATARQAFAPSIVHAAPPAGAAFRSYYFTGKTRVAMRVESDADPDHDELYFILHDHLGSTTVTLKRNGDGTLAKVGELRYNPWGKERASGYDASLTPTDYRFTDKRIETSFGPYHYDARWFDPTYGRFVQADTIIPDYANPQSLDRYAYALNNPLRYVDPSGHIPGPPPVCP